MGLDDPRRNCHNSLEFMCAPIFSKVEREHFKIHNDMPQIPEAYEPQNYIENTNFNRKHVL